MENSRQRHRRQVTDDQFDWRPGELVVARKLGDSAAIGELSARDLAEIKCWIGANCEARKPMLGGASAKAAPPTRKA
jgi:hypothetical protein